VKYKTDNMKQPTYYISQTTTAINANKMGILSPFLPDRRTLELHIMNETAMMKIEKGYSPKPIFVKVAPEEMDIMISAVKRKLKGFNLDHIPLRLQTKNLPIVIITKNQKDDSK